MCFLQLINFSLMIIFLNSKFYFLNLISWLNYYEKFLYLHVIIQIYSTLIKNLIFIMLIINASKFKKNLFYFLIIFDILFNNLTIIIEWDIC